MKKYTAFGAAILALMLLVLSGCGGGAEQKEAPAAPASGTPASGTSGSGGGQAAAGTSDSVDGTYAIVEGESKASYEVKEIFLIDSLNATAIGTTTAIEGDLVVKSGALQPSKVVVDVSKLKSDRSQRDGQLRNRGLETTKYPTAEFAINGVDLGGLAEGQEASFKLTGKAKIHGVEKELTWDATARMEGDALYLTGTTEFQMELFAIEPPNIAGRIRVDDGVKLKVEFVAKKG